MTRTMYHPPRFMTMEVLAEVLAEFEWPEPFALEDGLPDGIAVIFPRCTLFFVEGFESHMVLEFAPEDTGMNQKLTLTHALAAIRSDPGRDLPPEPKLTGFFSPGASLEKVKNGLRDLCTLLLTYLRPSILGDFSWVELHKAQAARAHRGI